MFIDTHAHLYLDRFNDDIDEVIRKCHEEGVDKIFLPNIDLQSIDSMHKLEDQYPDTIRSMMGLHPCSVKEDYNTVLDKMEMMLGEREYSGIGETGIDLYWDKTYVNEQILSFRRQIQWARNLKKPVIIHSRDSLEETISIIEELQDGNLTGVFHCFTGTLEQARRIQNTGFFMGIGGVLTFKNSGLREVIAYTDPDFLVLETDAPFLAPTPYRGKRNQSDYIPLIAGALADTMNMTFQEIELKTTENALKLFSES